MSENMIERVALALLRQWMNKPLLSPEEVGRRWTAWTPEMREPWLESARIAIEAMRDPVNAMVTAGCRPDVEGVTSTWQAMIDAALSPSHPARGTE